MERFFQEQAGTKTLMLVQASACRDLLRKEPSYYYNLALSYLILGDTARALEQQKKLQVLAPEVASQLASVIVKRQLR